MIRPRSLLWLGVPAAIGAALALWWVRSAGGTGSRMLAVATNMTFERSKGTSK